LKKYLLLAVKISPFKECNNIKEKFSLANLLVLERSGLLINQTKESLFLAYLFKILNCHKGSKSKEDIFEILFRQSPNNLFADSFWFYSVTESN